jgi:nitroreductase
MPANSTQLFPSFRAGANGVKPLERAILERRATPHFDGTPVPDEVIEAVLLAGAHAPSGYNFQPWRFLVLRAEDRRAALRRAAYDEAKITEAPVVIVGFAPSDGWKKTADEVFAECARRGAIPSQNLDQQKQQAVAFVETMSVTAWLNRHVMIAFTHMMLAAEVMGWDTAPMEGFKPAAVRSELALPYDVEVIALLAIGRAKGPDRAFPGRLPLKTIAFDNTVDRPWAVA